MELCELLASEDLILGFNPRDKWEAIAFLVDHLVRRGRIPKEVAPSVLEQVLARERSMSTGMEHGVAIPHAAVHEVSGVVASLGIIQREAGLPFDSIDGQPARLIVLLVSIRFDRSGDLPIPRTRRSRSSLRRAYRVGTPSMIVTPVSRIVSRITRGLSERA